MRLLDNSIYEQFNENGQFNVFFSGLKCNFYDRRKIPTVYNHFLVDEI